VGEVRNSSHLWSRLRSVLCLMGPVICLFSLALATADRPRLGYYANILFST